MFMMFALAGETPPTEPDPPVPPADAPAGAPVVGERIQIHWSEVQVKVRVAPEYPDAARVLGITSAECVVEIHIDAAGVPTRVLPVSCPEVFLDGTVRAAMQWRFYPVHGSGGQAVPVRFRLTVKYNLEDDSDGGENDFLAIGVAANTRSREDLHVDPRDGELSLVYGVVGAGILADLHLGYELRGATLGGRLGWWVFPASPVSPVGTVGHAFGFSAVSPFYTGLEPRVGLGVAPGDRLYAELSGGLDLRIGLEHYAVVVPSLSFQLGTRLGP